MASKAVAVATKQTDDDSPESVAEEMRQFLRETRRHRLRHRYGNEEPSDQVDNADVQEGESLTTCCRSAGSVGVYRLAVRLGEDFSPNEVDIQVDVHAGRLLVLAEHVEDQPGRRTRRSLKQSFQPPSGTDLGRLSSRFQREMLLIEAPYGAAGACGCSG